MGAGITEYKAIELFGQVLDPDAAVAAEKALKQVRESPLRSRPHVVDLHRKTGDRQADPHVPSGRRS